MPHAESSMLSSRLDTASVASHHLTARISSRSTSVWLLLGCLAAVLSAYHWLIYTPNPDQPHMLTILDRLFEIGLAGLVVFDGTLLGLRLLRWLPRRQLFTKEEFFALAAGLGLGAISLTVLVLGALHLYYGVTFAVLLMAAPLLLRDEVKQMARAARHALRRVQRRARVLWQMRRHSARAWTGWLSGAILPVVYLGLLFFVLVLDMTPPTLQTGYDTYQYHWAVPVLLLRAHGWIAFPGWAHANLPYNSEMLNLVALALRAPEAATLLQDTFNVLSAVLIFAAVRRFFGRAPAWVAVIAFATIPLIVVYGAQSYVESAMVFYGLATLTTLWCWLRQVWSAHSLSYGLLALAGAFFGLDIGVKYLALEFVPGALLLLAVGFIAYFWRRGLSPLTALPLASGKALAVLAASFALAFGPWLIKDWVLLGDPVYPALASIFVTPAWSPVRDQTLTATFQHFGLRHGFLVRHHLLALDLFIDTKLYGEGTTYPTGLAVIGAPFAVLLLILTGWKGWLAKRRMERGRFLFVLALSALAVLALVTWSFSGALVERYALPGIVLISVLGAVVVTVLLLRLPRRFSAISLLLVVLAVCCLVGQNGYYYQLHLGWRTPLPLLTGATSENAYMRSMLVQDSAASADFSHAVDYVNSQLPHDGKLLMLGRGSGYFFTDRDYIADSGGDWVPYIVTEGKTPDGMLRLLHQQGFTYIVYDAVLIKWLTWGYQNYVLARYLPAYLDFQSSELQLIAQWGPVSLYKVP